MAENINITPINPPTLELQEYQYSDTSLITSFNVDTSFNPETDYLEYFVYDLNGNILFQNISGFPGYKLINNDVVIYPQENLFSSGFSEGQYNTLYNFLSHKLGSNDFNPYYISQISSDRTEVRLDTTSIPNALVISSTTELINDITNSTGSYYDFYLNFGNNNLIIAVNALLDTTDPNNPTVLIKLYEPLPLQFDINSQCWGVTQVSQPVAYNINITQVFDIIDDKIYLKGPNTNLPITNQANNSTAYTNLTTLSATTSNQGSGSLKYQLSSLLEKRGVEINIDYSDYSNFIHFSSAQTRLENFYYKLGLIEQYNYSASYSTTTTTNYYVSQSNNIWQNKIDAIITTFDDYEYFLYFDSGSTCWPKTSSTPPYVNYSSNSAQGQSFLSSQSTVAEEYDVENNNALILAIPSYLREDSDNASFELFVEMVGQLFDNIFVYIQSVTSKSDNDNRLNYGAPKDLVADILRDLGIKIYQNNFSSNDLYQALIGITPSGSLYNLPFTTGSLPVPANSGLEYISTYITASSTSSLIPTSDINDSIYKRIYNSVPYILKKKGSVAGLRALINLFGVPDTILRISEFGGQNKINNNDYDYWYNQFNYAFYTSGSSYINTDWILNGNWGATNNVPQAVEFRFKTDALPTDTSSVDLVNLFTAYNFPNSGSAINLRYTGSGYASGSYSGSVLNPYYQYALLDFIPNVFTPSVSASIYLPFYNEDWWSVLINTSGSNGFTLYAKNKIYTGDDGNFIGFQASASVSASQNHWNNSTSANFGFEQVGGLAASIFTGSFQEVRYYTNALSESKFDDYVMNPYAIDGNDTNQAPEILAFRASLGSDLITSSVAAGGGFFRQTSIHPKITGSWAKTQSFAAGNSYVYYTGSYNYPTNTEVIFINEFPVGIKNRISNKIQQQNIVLPYSSSENNIPNSNTLSPFRSIQQTAIESGSYTKNINYVEIAFSPQNEINDDINEQLGYFNIGEYIGDPRLVSSSAESYPALDELRNDYFKKYTSNYQEWDYIRLIEFFDNSLFKMLQDFIPARSSLAAGIVVKQTVLERNKYPVPQVSPSSSIAFIGSGSSSIGIPYIVEDLTITGSIESGFITGSNGGSMPELFGQTASFLNYPNVVNVTQSWTGFSPSLYGPVSFTQDSQTEFFNGQLSGSSLVVDNYGKLNDCNVEIVQVYTTASLGTLPNLTYTSATAPLNFDFNFDKTYYITFTENNTGGSGQGGVYLIDGIGTIYYNDTTLPNGNSLTINQLQINNIISPLYFYADPSHAPNLTATNIFVYESYIEPDCLVVQNDAQVERVSTRYMDIDFITNGITAVNEQAILSGSATKAAVQDSNYTTFRVTNPRYKGCKLISPTGSRYEGFVNQQMISGSSIGALANVEQYCDWFAYFDSLQPVDYLVDEGGGPSALSAYPGLAARITSLININGDKIGLDPNNNILTPQGNLNPLISNISTVETIFPPNPLSFATSIPFSSSLASIKQFTNSSGSIASGSFNPLPIIASGYVPSYNTPPTYLVPNETFIIFLQPVTGSVPKSNTPGVLIPQNFNPTYRQDILSIAQTAGFFKTI